MGKQCKLFNAKTPKYLAAERVSRARSTVEVQCVCQQPRSPISAINDDGTSDGEYDIEFQQLPNGYTLHGGAENGILRLDLNDGVEQKSSDEEEEEETSREEFEWEIGRALREDENRRNAPLTTENATRVREAMHGVSFVGEVPRCVSEVSEDRWIDQIRRRRESPNS